MKAGTRKAMAPVKTNTTQQRLRGNTLLALAIVVALAMPALQAQSGSQTQSQPPANSQPTQDIPDAPSTVQPPPPPPKAAIPSAPTPGAGTGAERFPFPGDARQSADPNRPDQSKQDQDKAAQPSAPPVGTPPAGGKQRNQINSDEGLYKIGISVNRVQVPVMVKDSSGRRVDGLLPGDFTVLENGKKQTLVYFTSDPYALSVAVVIDTGMADVTLQKVNETYSALAGAFSPYDEVALYTYSSTVSQVTDFTGRPERITAALNDMKQISGHANGPPVLGGPLGPQGPTVNGAPAGGPIIAPVYTPPREAHVLNDAILRAAQDLSKRDRERRKVIFVISDGREMGSRASYTGVLHLLQARDIQVRAVVVDSGALPGFRQLERFHLPDQGRSNNLTRYVRATCGADPLPELSRNAIEDAYAEITSEARNQYTLGYNAQATTGSSAYRSIEVRVDKKGLKVAAKDGYFAIPTAH
jgi:VWFA-related protein